MNPELEALYQQKLRGNKTICHHLPVLRALASQASTCVEFGVRTGNSSVALLVGCAGTVYSWDLERRPEHIEIARAAGHRWVFTQGDSRTAVIPDCDLLLHDSFHNYEQVRAELEAHAHKVRRFLLFHDSIKYALLGGENHSRGNFNPHLAGFRLAVDELMIRDDSWRIKAHYPASDGLLVLERR